MTYQRNDTPEPLAQGVEIDKSTPGEWFVRTHERAGILIDCWVAASDCNGFAYDAEILGDDEYRDTEEEAGIERKRADCELIVKAVAFYRLHKGKGMKNFTFSETTNPETGKIMWDIYDPADVYVCTVHTEYSRDRLINYLSNLRNK